MIVTIEDKTYTYAELRSHDVLKFGDLAKAIGARSHAMGLELRANHMPLHDELRLKYIAKRSKIYRDEEFKADSNGLIITVVDCMREGCLGKYPIEHHPDIVPDKYRFCDKCRKSNRGILEFEEQLTGRPML